MTKFGESHSRNRKEQLKTAVVATSASPPHPGGVGMGGREKGGEGTL